jgi:hypothetical protein
LFSFAINVSEIYARHALVFKFVKIVMKLVAWTACMSAATAKVPNVTTVILIFFGAASVIVNTVIPVAQT